MTEMDIIFAVLMVWLVTFPLIIQFVLWVLTPFIDD
jgi:hypothetical protein